MERGKLFPVHVNHVVALTPPAHRPLQDTQVATHVMALAHGFQNQVIPARLAGEFLAVLGMKVGNVGLEVADFPVVDLVIK